MAELSFEPLTPTSFLARSAFVHAERPALLDGEPALDYRGLRERAARLAGAVLVALNMLLSATELGHILDHCGASVVLCDDEFEPLAHEAIAAGHSSARVIATTEYERLIDQAPEVWHGVEDERGLLSIDYTSATTGRAKGVMYHHRGAYLQSLAMAFHSQLSPDSVFLWTLPMFHCNGWCFTSAVTATGARHVCLPRLDPAAVWRLIDEAEVTHLCAAPTVLIDLASHPEAHRPRRPLRTATGGAPPSPALLERFAGLEIDVTHLHGLTETFGPVVVCDWKPEWDEPPGDRRARLKARQGVGNVIAQRARVLAPDGGDVPADGETLGEIAVRGNDVMLGYYRDPDATAAAAPDGWFHTADLGVMHPDGYLELRDRLKDVIISGGENIASVEIEQAIASHPAVLEVAVVARPDERFGERPVAFVRCADGSEVTETEIIEHVRGRLARFKAPSEVVFRDELPRTTTGKVQKFALREEAVAAQAQSQH